MNNKGQDVLEYLLLIGAGVIVSGIIIVLVTGFPITEYNSAAENFCEAWAEERSVTHLRGQYLRQFSGRVVECEYSSDSDVFDGGVSAGRKQYKYFKISEEALLEWADKTESKDCCEVCE